jgi:heme-degrading monooxygenase HmoA
MATERRCDMVARVWSAQATAQGARAYAAHFNNHVLPALRKLNGFVRAMLLERPQDEVVEILVLTFWQSLDSIRAFAGADLEKAVVADEAVPLLKHFDKHVRHFNVAEFEEDGLT